MEILRSDERRVERVRIRSLNPPKSEFDHRADPPKQNNDRTEGARDS